MNALSLTKSPTTTMISLDLLKVINQFRIEDDKPEMAHRNFIQKIEDELEEAALKFQSSYKGKDGAMVKCYNLPKKECLLVAMRESKAVRRKTADYIESLEKPKELSLEQIMANGLIAAQSVIKESQLAIETQQLKIEQDAPKVAFHDQVAAAPDTISVAKAAKIIGTGRNRLLTFLRMIGWVTKRNEPLQAKITCGYLDSKLGDWTHPDHGIQQSITTVVTGKGLTKLQQLWTEAH